LKIAWFAPDQKLQIIQLASLRPKGKTQRQAPNPASVRDLGASLDQSATKRQQKEAFSLGKRFFLQ
jgi:hypothetical protein